MNGGGGPPSFRPTWLRLNEAIAILVDRAVKREVAKKSLSRAIASGSRVGLGGGPPSQPFTGSLRFRVFAEIRSAVGRAWQRQPNLNFQDPTIEVPSLGGDDFEIK